MIASLVLAANVVVAPDDDQAVTLDVEKITCATCATAVRKAMQRVDGVKEVNVDSDIQTAIVTFDPSITTTAEIEGASANVGFPVSILLLLRRREVPGISTTRFFLRLTRI